MSSAARTRALFGALDRVDIQLALMRHELAGDGVGLIGRLDQGGHVGGDRHRILRRDALKLRQALGRDQAGVDEAGLDRQTVVELDHEQRLAGGVLAAAGRVEAQQAAGTRRGDRQTATEAFLHLVAAHLGGAVVGDDLQGLGRQADVELLRLDAVTVDLQVADVGIAPGIDQLCLDVAARRGDVAPRVAGRGGARV